MSHGQGEDPARGTGLLIYREGFSSIFAAAQLQELGCANATDVIGGVAAWKAGGLPILGQADQMAVDAKEAVAG